MRLVSMYFPTTQSNTTASPSSLSSNLNVSPGSLHCFTSSRSSGRSGKPSLRGCFFVPSGLNKRLLCSRLLSSLASLCAANSLCSATRVAAVHGLSSSGMASTSAMSSSSGPRSLASDTLDASSMSTPSARSSFISRSVTRGSSCLLRMRSEGVTSLPSRRLSWGKVPMTKARYPPKSAHGLPMRYRSSSFGHASSVCTVSSDAFVMKFIVRSSFCRLSHRCRFSIFVTLLRAMLRYSSSLSLCRFWSLEMRLFCM